MGVKRFLAASVVAALSLTLWPAPAQAQRRAVRVVRPPAVIVRAYPPFYYDPWGPFYPYGWYGPYPYGQRSYYNGAALRLQVTPRTAEVYVDGYYAGIVDQFDGTFQRLRVVPGEHEIAVYADGYRTFTQQLYLQPLSTVTVRQALEPLPAGAAQEPRPAPSTTGQAPPPPRRQAPPAPRPPIRPEPRENPAPPPPAPQASRETGSFGVLSVRVQPGGADVLIDGERWEGPGGGDERLLVQLTPGSHQVEIRRAGYQTFTRAVEVRPGQTETLNVSLTRQ